MEKLKKSQWTNKDTFNLNNFDNPEKFADDRNKPEEKKKTPQEIAEDIKKRQDDEAKERAWDPPPDLNSSKVTAMVFWNFEKAPKESWESPKWQAIKTELPEPSIG